MDGQNERFSLAVDFLKRNGYAKNGREMSERMGVTESALSMARKGARVPSLELMARMCEVYPIDFWWLRTGEGSMVRGEREHFLLKRIDELEDELRRLKGQNI